VGTMYVIQKTLPLLADPIWHRGNFQTGIACHVTGSGFGTARRSSWIAFRLADQSRVSTL
jgi:hypothetical protein